MPNSPSRLTTFELRSLIRHVPGLQKSSFFKSLTPAKNANAFVESFNNALGDVKGKETGRTNWEEDFLKAVAKYCIEHGISIEGTRVCLPHLLMVTSLFLTTIMFR